MGFDDPGPVGRKMKNVRGLIVILLAAAVFLGCIYSPPHLMDDVDAVQAQISREHAAVGRLGHGAAQRRSLSREVSAWILAERDVISDFRCSRLGCPAASVPGCRHAMFCDLPVWYLGVRQEGRILFRRRVEYVGRAISFHPHHYPGRHTDSDHLPGVVVASFEPSIPTSNARASGHT